MNKIFLLLVAADTGNTTANSASDTLTIAGGTNITTAISGDTVTVLSLELLTSTFAALTDTDVTGITQGDSLFWNGTDWVVTRSPMTWWELNADGASHYTFNGPGFVELLTIQHCMFSGYDIRI